MRKRVFIAIHYMEIGGGEMSLLGLLKAIDYTQYEVDLFIYSHKGQLMQYIPKEVNVLPEIARYADIERPIIDVIKHGSWKIAYARLKTKRQYYSFLKKNRLESSDEVYRILAENITPYLPSLESFGEYDLAINYLGLPRVVLQKVMAKKKVCWIHTDYTAVRLNADKDVNTWGAFDHIVSISPDVTRSFLETFPSLEYKIVEIENIISSSFVRQRAGLIPSTEIHKEMPRETNVVNLLSVGRFCEAKNYDNVPDICRRVNSILSTVDSHLLARWYIIGWGGDEELIRHRIKECNMQECVILLGKKDNPYPFIKACDIYVQPSRYEGKSITVREAQLLLRPVVIANYKTAKSQVIDGVDGIIVPLDNEGFAKGLSEVIIRKDKRDRIVAGMKQRDYEKADEVKRINDLFS